MILRSGLHSAGKDTFIKKHYQGWPVISLDHMRAERGISSKDKTGTGQVIQEAKEQALIYLREQEPIIWKRRFFSAV